MKKFFAAILATIVMATGALADGTSPHRLAVHVDQNDPQVMNLALNNIANVNKYYKDKGEEVTIELVTYGPGLNMLIPGKSPVEDRISAMALEMDNVVFAACENTRTAMSKKAGKEIQILDEATSVPSGVVRLMELQEQGYSYVRP